MDQNIRTQASRPASASIPPQGPPILSHLHQYQAHSPYQVPQPHTLPPLQHPQSHSPMPSYLGQPFRNDMPRYPVTSTHDVYAASTAPMATHAPVNSLPPASFLGQHQQPQQQFPSHGLLPPTTGAQAYPQPIAPAPPRDRRHEYGMPGAPFTGAEDKGPMWAAPDAMSASTAAYPPKDAPRTQVVGSQGRRGILPSVPGRAAITNGVNGTAKGTAIPAKDADGKFPCPHCNKTYLHAKHLKRHLLRHTGDRPYMCVLCKDTFSRSDILKRHFQKCSLRRGNPTGISHLSHPHAHLKKAQAAGVVPKPVNQGDAPSQHPPPQHPHPQQPQQNIDWSVLQSGSHENYMPGPPVYPTSMTPVNDGMHAHVDADRKYYPATTAGQQENGGLNGLYLASTSLSGDGTVQPARQ
ncbi:hypothetical protein H112_03544 [Trichophyton rubrum D6]|uniref:C2H2-type domain-containing protein n=3 Tax=Trichophyton TaxID=5550 RepID=A0A080WUK3_TRIRC|nr:uncharacterized protein TERG_04871 [Trichophyton rubrum CBS 118892]XP_047606433.1 uncharacterized protein TERG_04871 [Trichophyton rubrum CBS 118892]XP_047606434.1 uncharacterized protein TERG_04871 [Trichophyton rubrum CBS 118892]EZF23838.1 hypothetical protein H100_03550 [Trichophyton rubrum MR850]EZF42925.1 hypothetical protein H102_03542 [Trichophyton rubrum CBS 100081]EZF53575.1 hypothetical protein H103_03553 [Trichophyton rubrum CBS 288.86]EZF64165.1 hypothetical protein H104_03540 